MILALGDPTAKGIIGKSSDDGPEKSKEDCKVAEELGRW